MNLEAQVSATGEFYVKITDIIKVVQLLIEGGKTDHLDTNVMEALFVWLGKQHEKLEEEQKQKKALQFEQYRGEFERLMEKYKNDQPESLPISGEP